MWKLLIPRHIEFLKALIFLYNILYIVSTQQHQYSNIMYAVDHTVVTWWWPCAVETYNHSVTYCIHYIDVVVYWRYIIYYTIVSAQRDGFCQIKKKFIFCFRRFWVADTELGIAALQPGLSVLNRDDESKHSANNAILHGVVSRLPAVFTWRGTLAEQRCICW